MIYNPYTKNSQGPFKSNQFKRKNELMLTKPTGTILKLCGSRTLESAYEDSTHEYMNALYHEEDFQCNEELARLLCQLYGVNEYPSYSTTNVAFCAFDCVGQLLYLLHNVRNRDWVHHKHELQMFWEQLKSHEV